MPKTLTACENGAKCIILFVNFIHKVPSGERTLDFSLACMLKLVFSAPTSLVD